jgi:CheY-like chemotaxis protein
MGAIKLIAIVDDDEVHQFTLKKQIEFSGLSDEIIVFSDGEEVFKHFESNLNNPERIPDVIFLDINMPIMDGWDFVSEFKRLKSSLTKEVSIFMVSSSIREEDIRRAKGILEISDYIVKPISSQTLFNLIQSNP